MHTTKVLPAALCALLPLTGCGGPAASAPAPDPSAHQAATEPGSPSAVTSELQPIVDAEIARLAGDGAVRASIVVLDPASGGLLAVAGHGALGAAEAERVGPTGSTVKALTVAAALDAGLDPSREFDGEAGHWTRADGTELRDHVAHQRLDARGVLVHSSNIGAAKIVDAVGAAPIRAAFTRAGLTLDASGHAASQGAGIDVVASPLTLARVYGALGNGGERVDAETGARQRVVSEASAEAVLEMLLAAVGPEGTGRRAGGLTPAVGGKTGTTQDGEALFAGFVPIERPRYVVVVRAQMPEQSYGGAVAAPSFRRIAEGLLSAD